MAQGHDYSAQASAGQLSFQTSSFSATECCETGKHPSLAQYSVFPPRLSPYYRHSKLTEDSSEQQTAFGNKVMKLYNMHSNILPILPEKEKQINLNDKGHEWWHK